VRLDERAPNRHELTETKTPNTLRLPVEMKNSRGTISRENVGWRFSKKNEKKKKSF
jgi:hypothetical protein